MKNICLAFITAIYALGCTGGEAEEKQTPQAAEPTIEVEWFFLNQGARFGPLTETELRKEYQKGRLHPDFQVWSEQNPEWQSLDSLLLNVTPGGATESGEKWDTVFRQMNRIAEPIVKPPQVEMTYQQARAYLNTSKDVLTNARALKGKFGPLPEVTEDNRFSRATSARKLARLLRHDIENAIAENDPDRALEDMATLCSLAHQMNLIRSPVDPSMAKNVNDANEYLEFSKLYSISVVSLVSAIILDSKNASLSAQLEDVAVEHMAWSTPELLNYFDQTVGRQRKLPPDAVVRMDLARSLLSQ